MVYSAFCAFQTENGIVRRDFNKTQRKEQVTETLLLFTKRRVDILVSV